MDVFGKMRLMHSQQNCRMANPRFYVSCVTVPIYGDWFVQASSSTSCLSQRQIYLDALTVFFGPSL